MTKKELISTGRIISYLLRHTTEMINNKGWADTHSLIKRLGIKMNDLIEIVETNDKKRYEFSNDKRKIRALQGHSVDVDVDLKEETPTSTLYHGTNSSSLESIFKDGICSKKRLYVHLTSDKENAFKSGKRHGGEPIIIPIDIETMIKDGIVFYHTKNDVWLTKFIDKKYILDIF